MASVLSSFRPNPWLFPLGSELGTHVPFMSWVSKAFFFLVFVSSALPPSLGRDGVLAVSLPPSLERIVTPSQESPGSGIVTGSWKTFSDLLFSARN